MKQDDVKLGEVYGVKVSGRVQPVKLEREVERFTTGRTNWIGTNQISGREIRIRSAAKLRYRMVKDSAGWHQW